MLRPHPPPLFVRALVLVLIISGCAPAPRTVDPGAAGIANRALEGRRATITLVSGVAFQATSVRFEADSTSWMDPRTRRMVVVPTADVVEVRRAASGRGALRGALVGAAIAGLGAYLAATDGCLLSCVGNAQLAGTVGAVFTAPFGAGLGALAGPEFDPPPRWRPSMPSDPRR